MLLEEDGVEVRLKDNIWCVDLKKYGWSTTIEDAMIFAEQFDCYEE